MSIKRKSILIVVVVLVSLILVGLAICWFAVVPGMVRSKIDDALAKAEEKTGRHITISDVALKSPKRLVLMGISVTDDRQNPSMALKVDTVDLQLAALPVLNDIRIARLEVGNVDLSITSEDGSLTFDDIKKLLPISDKEKSDDEDKDENKPDDKSDSKWKQYVTPFPEVSVASVKLSMPAMEMVSGFSLKGAKLDKINLNITTSPDKKQTISFSADATGQFSENGLETTYTSSIKADVVSKKEGEVTLTMPRNSYGELPLPFRLENYVTEVTAVKLTLPSTVSLIEPKLDYGERTLFKADELRVQLMSFPPKKVNGVYIKEFELKKPVIKVEFSDDTNDLKTFASVAKTAFSSSKSKSEASSEESGSSNEKKKSNVKDYYFSQRFFVSDASVMLRDMRKASRGDIHIENLSLESGYRGIRKIVDYQIDVIASAPVATKFRIGGTYDLKSEDINTIFNVEYLNFSDAARNMRDKIRAIESVTNPDKEARQNVKYYEKVFALFDFKEATGRVSANLKGSFAKKSLSLNAIASSTGLALNTPLINTEPLMLDSQVDLHVDLDYVDQPVIEIKQLRLSKGAAFMTFNGKFSREHVVTTPKKVNKAIGVSEYNTWNYDFSMQLPEQRAQGVFEAIPHALRSEMDGMEIVGSIGFTLDVKGRMDQIDDTQHKFTLNKSDDFAVLTWPVDRNVNKLNTGFVYNVNDPNALNPHSIVVPPSIYPIVRFDPIRRMNIDAYTPRLLADDVRFKFRNWVLFEDLNPWLVQLITTTEDGSFFTHEGFSTLQIKAALAKNVSRGEFNRGASTISMQLVKNVFFDRNKTLARKVQEALYTWLTESIVAVPKQRIMEIYFNIIEFGPEIYGIEEASKYYFGKRSEALTLKEAAFLVAIIPGPRRGTTYRLQGSINKSLQKTIDFYIREMYRRKCSPDTLSQMRARYEKKGIQAPFEPCCPNASSLELMQKQDISFYLPNPANPAEYGYNPAFYREDGTPIVPIRRSCGITASASTDELGSIFEVFEDGALPASNDVD